jgi:tetratricopeptide (TPR) repeat protein
MRIVKYISLILICLTSINSYAQSKEVFEEELLLIQHNWANVNYELTGDEQEDAFEKLEIKASSLVRLFPSKAEARVWHGIVQSSYAGAKGGLGALSLAKSAKKSFEKAIEIDGTVLLGSAYTSLGILYHKVPGWPLGFGDDDDAKDLLEKALKLNPNGIDSNYFYGEFMYDEGKYKIANEYLLKAKSAPVRRARPLADQYRQNEIMLLLAKVDKKLNK